MFTSILDYLVHTAARLPEKACYVEPHETVCFSDALQRVYAIGTRLMATDVFHRPVAVMMERGADCMLAQLGVLAAGGFFVPIDPKMPPERIGMILDKIQPAALIHQGPLENLPVGRLRTETVVYLEALSTTPDMPALNRIRSAMIDGDLAYVLFTSGSTGTPKGVAASHRALMNYLDWTCEDLGIDEETVFGNAAPCYFVLAFLDMFGALKTGATTHIIPKKCFLFPKLMVAYLNEHRIDTIFWAPTALMNLSSSGIFEKETPRYLKRVIFAGEVMRMPALNIWRGVFPNVRFYNFYGATETTGLILYYPVDRHFSDHEALPVGRCCANNRSFLLDGDGNAVAPGQVGELCAMGASLAYGYYGDAEKTAAAFTQNPLMPLYPARIYHTGDIMRVNEYGEFVYAGRKDAMVKHMGYRVELGEIEHGVMGLSGIQNACCLHDEKQDLLLCAYAGSMPGADVLVALKEKLPAYMLPNRFLQLEAMPLTANGKIDRMKLVSLFEGEAR